MRISKEEILLRHARVRQTLEEAGFDALILQGSCAIDQRGWMRYFIDYYVPVFSEFLVLPLDGPIAFFARNGANGKAVEESGLVDRVQLIPSAEADSKPGKCVGEYLRSIGAKRPVICGETDRAFLASLLTELDVSELPDLTDAMKLCRTVKSQEELQLCRQAVTLNEMIFKEFLKNVGPGKKEIDAVAAASYFAQTLGCEDQFWLIGSGKAPRLGSLPQAIKKQHVWQPGDLCSVVIEIAGPGGYYGEVTHLISIGEPEEEVVRVFHDLREARRAAEEVIAPGNLTKDICEAFNRRLLKEGNWENPITGVIGHGQGLDMSEWPMIDATNSLMLKEGMRLNLHPNLVLNSGVGVTACDCYEVTKNGCQRLTALPDEFIIV